MVVGLRLHVEATAIVDQGEGGASCPLKGRYGKGEGSKARVGSNVEAHGLLPVCAVGVADEVRRLSALTCPLAVEELVPDEQGKKDDESEKVLHSYSMLMSVVDQVASVSMRTKRVLGSVGSAM